MEPQFNLPAILVAAVAHFFVGWVWFTLLFGKSWAKEMGFDKWTKAQKAKGMKRMPKSMAINFAALLVTAWILSHIIQFSIHFYGNPGIKHGLLTGLFVWLGFFATAALNSVAWENKSWKLYAINTGHHLVGLLVMGAILAAWK